MLIQKKDPKYCNDMFHSKSSWLGDGYCDNSLNNKENCFDGGDCDRKLWKDIFFQDAFMINQITYVNE